MLQEYHVHTTYCDGRSTVEELVRTAISRGFERLGFSGHSYTFFDESYCMSREGTEQYRREVAEAKEKYKGQIEILCGVEQDYWSEESTDGYDYVIGSVHYLRSGDRYYPIDETAGLQKKAAGEIFGGDMLSVMELYYETVGDVVARTGCDIIGHFDVAGKFNYKHHLFDERDPRHVRAWQRAADRLLATEKPFEINTRAILGGYRPEPYPCREIYEYLKARGARFILSTDCHFAPELGFAFDKVKEMYGING